MIFRGLGLITLWLFSMCSEPAYAIDTEAAVVQGNSTSVTVPVAGKYKRYDNKYAGARVTFIQPFDEFGNYRVETGESWYWEWLKCDPACATVLAEVGISYMGGDNHCFFISYSQSFRCGTFGAFTVLADWHCMKDETTYAMRVYHNGQIIRDETFTTQRFRPTLKRDNIQHEATLQPRVYVYGSNGLGGTLQDGESTDIEVLVVDDLECNQKLKDVKVKLVSNVQGGVNGHAHFSGDNNIGTGRFESIGYDAVVNPDNITALRETVVEGKSDADGVFRVKYQAKDLGAIDMLKYVATRPKRDDEPELTSDEIQTTVEISVPGLVSAENGYTINADGNGCPHSPLPRQLTWNYALILHLVARDYNAETGSMISLNDGSLPTGGVIDNRGGLGRDVSCHDSHRQGQDLDFNHADSSGLNIETATISLGGEIQTRRQRLHFLLTEKYGSGEWDGHVTQVTEETSIHYRYY